jgi:ADP-ribose pyrophosphatase
MTVERGRLQWKGKSWQLRIVDILSPEGDNVEKGFIDHPGSVVIVPSVNEKILMLQQYRLALDQVILELPAGTREIGEEWLACAKRELREETGYRAENWQHLGHVWPAPGITNEMMAIYLATDLKSDPLPGDFDEQIEVVPSYFSEMIEMALNGSLQDAKSIVALLRASAFLNEIEP